MWSTKYQVRAHSPYVSEHPMDLSFAEGEVIDVLGEESSDWLNGCTEDGRFGSFPKQFVSDFQQGFTPQQNHRQINSEHNIVASKPVPPARPDSRPAIPVATRPTTHSTAAKAVPSLPPRNPPAMPKRPSSSKATAQGEPEIGRYTPDNSQDIIDRLRNTTPVTAPDFVEPIYWEESDMAELDEYARACPPEYTHSVQDLAAYLTDPFPEPLHKIRAIFAWVTDNISYDVHSFLNHLRKSQQPQDVLKSRSSVCEGYARLTQALGEACHLPIRMISGYAKGAFLKPQKGLRVDERGAHAWNCIQLHGQYLMIDSTWGAGHLSTDGNPSFTKAFNPFFFLTDPTQFIYSHFPKDINEQYLNPPFSESEFFDLPWTKETYHRHNLLLLSPKPRTSVMETNDDTLDIFIEAQSNGALGKPDGISGHLKGKDGKVQPVIGQRAVGYKEEGRDVWWIHVVCSQSGEFELELFVYKSVADDQNAGIGNIGRSCLTMTVLNSGRGSAQVPVQLYSLPRPLTLVSPLYQNVSLGTEHFKIIMPTEPSERNPPKITVMSSWQDQQVVKLVKQEPSLAWYEADITFRQATTYHLCIEKPTAQVGRSEVSYICAFNPT